jgi:DNA-binding FadR family transcriptional regulator
MKPTTRTRTTDRLRQDLLRGRWSPGQTLPPERSLAAELGVSRPTLRGALATLHSEGLVQARQGSGVIALDPLENASLDIFTWMLQTRGSYDASTADLFAEFCDLRRVLAADTVARASRRITPEDLTQLEDLVTQQATRLDEPDAYLAGDERFVREVLRIAGGTAIVLVFNTLTKMMAQHSELVLLFYGDLGKHHASYRPILRLLRAPGRLVRPTAVRALLEKVERAGLQRVREHCEAQAR